MLPFWDAAAASSPVLRKHLKADFLVSFEGIIAYENCISALASQEMVVTFAPNLIQWVKFCVSKSEEKSVQQRRYP